MLTESRSRNQLLQKAYFLSAVDCPITSKQPLIGQVNIGQFWFKSAKLVMVTGLSGVQIRSVIILVINKNAIVRCV